MNIRAIHIDGFGALRDVRMELTDGINVLLRENGWGKSTLAVFVKAMLYGLPASTRRSLIENERKRYTPWQGDAFGGSMDVEVDGRTLRIERAFGKTEAADTLLLTDLGTGLPVSIPDKLSPGEAWFGVDAGAYERSTYLSQREVSEDDGALSIHAKLNRLVDATDDIGSFDRAIELLEKQRKYYAVSGGRRGEIAAQEQTLQHLEEQLAQCKEAATIARAYADELERQKALQRENAAAQAQLQVDEQCHRDRLSQQAHLLHYRDLLSLAERERNAEAEALSLLGGSLPTQQAVEMLERLEHEIAGRTLQADRLTLELSDDAPETAELQELARLFETGVPEDAALDELQQLAEAWSDAERRCAEAEQLASPMQDAATPAQQVEVEADELARLRGICSESGARRQAVSEQQRTLASQLQSLQHRCHRTTRQSRGMGGAAALVLLAGVLLGVLRTALLPVVLPVGAAVALALAAGALLLRRSAAKENRQCDDIAARLRAAGDRRAQYDREWQTCSRRLRELAGKAATAEPLGAAEAMTLLAQIERAQERRHIERDRLEHQKQQQAALRSLCEQQRAAWARAWQRGAVANAADAVGQVTQLRARVQDYRRALAQREITLRQRETVCTEIEQRKKALKDMLGAMRDLPAERVSLRIRERIGVVVSSRENAARFEQQARQLREEHCAVVDADTPIMSEEQVLAAEAVLRERKQLLAEQAQELERNITLTRSAMQQQSEIAAAMDGIQDEMAATEASIAEDRASLKCVLATAEFLKQAKESLSGRYLQRMKQSFANYFAAVAGEDAASFTMDGNFVVKLRRGGASRSVAAFNTGMRDVIALCARLALIDALFENETPFLVLDDPLTNMDDQTAQRAMTLLARCAEKYQMLYLTCHTSRAIGTQHHTREEVPCASE